MSGASPSRTQNEPPAFAGLSGPARTDQGQVPSGNFSELARSDYVVAALGRTAKDIRAWCEKQPAAELPKSILLHGNESAKASLVRAFCGESGCQLVTVSAHSILGEPEPAEYLGRIFSAAGQRTEEGPQRTVTVVWIDGLQLLFNASTAGDEEPQPTRALHSLLARLKTTEPTSEPHQVVVVATADSSSLGRASVLEQAFDQSIEVLAPASVPERLAIFSHYFKQRCSELQTGAPTEQDLIYLSRMTAGCPEDELIRIGREAIRAARAAEAGSITLAHLVEGFQMRVRGPVRPDNASPEERERIERHEDGHAVIAQLLDIPILLISTSSRGKSGGSVFPDQSAFGERVMTRKQALSSLLVALGGLASERVHYNIDGVSLGGGQDLLMAQRLVYQMLGHGLFMEVLGSFHAAHHGGPNAVQWDMVSNLISTAFTTAEKIISAIKEPAFKKMSEARRTIGTDIFGADAANFYTEFITDSRKGVERFLKAFFEKPFGDNVSIRKRDSGSVYE